MGQLKGDISDRMKADEGASTSNRNTHLMKYSSAETGKGSQDSREQRIHSEQSSLKQRFYSTSEQTTTLPTTHNKKKRFQVKEKQFLEDKNSNSFHNDESIIFNPTNLPQNYSIRNSILKFSFYSSSSKEERA